MEVDLSRPVDDGRVDDSNWRVEITSDFGTSAFKVEHGVSRLSVHGDLETDWRAVV